MKHLILTATLALGAIPMGCNRSSPTTPFVQGGSNAPGDEYQEAISDGLKRFPILRKLSTVSPQSMNSITYFTGEYGHPQWISKTGLFNRYILVMEAPLTLTTSNRQIVAVGEPSYYLYEITKIKIRPSSGPVINSIKIAEFRDQDWNKIFPLGGGISFPGVNILTNSPVDNFTAALSGF